MKDYKLFIAGLLIIAYSVPLSAKAYDLNLTQRLQGRILLQVQAHGEAWYVRAADSLRYYMKDGATAYQMMRNYSQGITDADLAKIPHVNNTTSMNQSTSVCNSNALANRMKGKILLQVQQHGEAWYVHPTKCRAIYMADGAAAYQIMRYLGFGITNNDLEKIQIGEIDSGVQPVNASSILYSVTEFVDGDTFKISINGKEETFRLIGMDTPETVDPRKPIQCFGMEASNKAKELLSGNKIRFEADLTQGERDMYGRLLAYVYREDGLFYNKYMIEQGYAHEYTYNTPYKYQIEFKAAQKSAQENQRGLWNPDTCNGTASSTSGTIQPTPVQQPTQPSGHTFYLSSYNTAVYYYCDTDEGWGLLSPKYLKSYSSEQALLKDYPSRTLHEACK